MGLNLEWKRFTTWNMNDYMEFEIDLVKKLTPDRPVTTNFMQLYGGLDYRKMTELIKELITNAGIRIKELPENVEYHERYTDTLRYAFYIDEGDVAAELLNVTELLSGQVVNGKISVDAKNVMIIKGKI